MLSRVLTANGGYGAARVCRLNGKILYNYIDVIYTRHDSHRDREAVQAGSPVELGGDAGAEEGKRVKV